MAVRRVDNSDDNSWIFFTTSLILWASWWILTIKMMHPFPYDSDFLLSRTSFGKARLTTGPEVATVTWGLASNLGHWLQLNIYQTWCRPFWSVTIIPPPDPYWQYTIWDPILVFTVPAYQHVETCSDYRFWYTLTSNLASGFTIIYNGAPVPPTFTVYSNNTFTAGNYTITIKAKTLVISDGTRWSLLL